MRRSPIPPASTLRLLTALFALLTLVFAASITAASPAFAQTAAAGTGAVQPAQDQMQADASGANAQVYLITVGQGSWIWEKFGHNAIWIRDEAAGIDVAWNWGIFAWGPGFIPNLIRGNMIYRMEGFDGVAMVNAYVRDNRTVWVQELNLTAAQKVELLARTRENAREENKYYRYDYYRDNCSTRVRDMLDVVLGGALRRHLEGEATGKTYRWHTDRLTADMPAEYTGLLLALGPSTDRPIDAWEESFLPVKLMEHVRGIRVERDGGQVPLVMGETEVFTATRPPERSVPPERTLWYGLAGLLLGTALFALGRTPGRAAGGTFYTLAIVWSLVIGIAGALIAGLWAFSEHTITFHNENVLQSNIASLVLVVALILTAFGRAERFAVMMAGLVVTLAMLGFVLQVLPLFDQPNGEMIALMLPAHAGLALGLRARVTVTPPSFPAEPAEETERARRRDRRRP
jgi:hypothetical protein